MKKNVSLLLALLLLLSATACGQASHTEASSDTDTTVETHSETDADADTETDSDTETETESESETTIDQETEPSPYAEVISLYTQLLTCKQNGNDLPARDEDAENEGQKAILDVLYATLNGTRDPLAMGYATQDMNGDGVEELMLLSEDRYLYGLFTLEGDAPVALVAPGGGYGCIFSDGTLFYYDPKPLNTGWTYHFVDLAGDELTGFSFGCTKNDGEKTIHHKTVNNVYTEITQQEYVDLDNIYVGFGMPYMVARQNWLRGFRYIPAIKDEAPSENSPPLADASTYEAILDMYKNIVSIFPDYTTEAWKNGAYEDMYTFPDNETYRVFHSILYAGALARPTTTYFGDTFVEGGHNAYGYAYKDINKDGTDELILLVDTFDILAIFTEVNGKAVLLDSYWGDKVCWLGNDGIIRVDWISNAFYQIATGFRMYKIAANGSLSLITRVEYAIEDITSHQYNYYKLVDGRRVMISDEEGKALRTQYDICPEKWSEQAYTKVHAGLPFIPLFDAVTPDASLTGKTFSNSRFINDPGFTITAADERSVSFSMPYRKYSYENYQEELVYETVIEATATLTDGVYTFDNGTVKGYLDFGVNLVWLVITESNQEHIPLMAKAGWYYEED